MFFFLFADATTTTDIIKAEQHQQKHSAALSTIFIIIGLLLFTLLLFMFRFTLPPSLTGRRWRGSSWFESKMQIMHRPTMWSTHPMRNEISAVTVYQDNVRKAVLYGDDNASLDDHGAVVRQQKETGRKAVPVCAPGKSKFTKSNIPLVHDLIKTKRKVVPVSHHSSILRSEGSMKRDECKVNPEATAVAATGIGLKQKSGLMPNALIPKTPQSITAIPLGTKIKTKRKKFTAASV